MWNVGKKLTSVTCAFWNQKLKEPIVEEKHFTIPTQTVTDMQADHMPALNLAYVGDTLYDLYVRTRLVTESNAASGKLQKIAVRKVCAQGQAHGLQAILESLTDEEKEIVRKGRNARDNTLVFIIS